MMERIMPYCFRLFSGSINDRGEEEDSDNMLRSQLSDLGDHADSDMGHLSALIFILSLTERVAIGSSSGRSTQILSNTINTTLCVVVVVVYLDRDKSV